MKMLIVGAIWEFYNKNPFQVTEAKIIALKDDWVQYEFVDGLPVKWSLPQETFKKIYTPQR